MSGHFSLYQSVIHKTRYARYLDEDQRREHWDETVLRYLNYVISHVESKHNYKFTTEEFEKLQDYIFDMKVMPSMRAMMTSGKALDRDNVCAYNCAYLPIDDVKAFDEAMFILLCGTGVGFSVERQYINQLPEVPDKIFDSDTTIVVKDSKEGWAKAYRQLIALLYSGEISKWDLSKLRPAGARLKTFGGRSAGPGPLEDLFKFTVRVFKNAQGRKLTSLECHDIMCKIGEVVVVGGVRRCLNHKYEVYTNEGWKNIKSLTGKEKIIINNKEFNILNIFDNGYQETVNIKMQDGTIHNCTADHKWFVYDTSDKTAKWIKAKELNENHKFLKPKNMSGV